MNTGVAKGKDKFKRRRRRQTHYPLMQKGDDAGELTNLLVHWEDEDEFINSQDGLWAWACRNEAMCV